MSLPKWYLPVVLACAALAVAGYVAHFLVTPLWQPATRLVTWVFAGVMVALQSWRFKREGNRLGFLFQLFFLVVIALILAMTLLSWPRG